MRPGVPTMTCDALAQRLELRAVADAAVDGERAYAQVPAHRLDLVADLERQLARRRHHERLGYRRGSSRWREDRDAEGARLPAAGARLDDQVAAALHRRDDARLHRHRILPAEVADPRAEFLGEAIEAREQFFRHRGAEARPPGTAPQRRARVLRYVPHRSRRGGADRAPRAAPPRRRRGRCAGARPGRDPRPCRGARGRRYLVRRERRTSRGRRDTAA